VSPRGDKSPRLQGRSGARRAGDIDVALVGLGLPDLPKIIEV
jgi:hypothetical protein